MKSFPSFAALFCVGLGACAYGPPIQTASRQPEITLTNVDASCVRSVFLNALVNQQFSVRSASDFQIIAGKERRDDVGFLYSTRGYGFPEDRITALLIQTPPNGLRIVVSESIVSNPGTAFERTNPISQTQDIQNQFASYTQRFQSQCPKM
jgi:hypothetical protein